MKYVWFVLTLFHFHNFVKFLHDTREIFFFAYILYILQKSKANLCITFSSSKYPIISIETVLVITSKPLYRSSFVLTALTTCVDEIMLSLRIPPSY